MESLSACQILQRSKWFTLPPRERAGVRGNGAMNRGGVQKVRCSQRRPKLLALFPRKSISASSTSSEERLCMSDTGRQSVNTSNVLSVIMGGGQGARLFPLTKERAKPAVPLAGKYRLVDIPISNCINSGLRRIYLLTQFNSASLHRHIS